MEQENRDTIRLLIVDASSEEAEALLNVYRDAGYPTRAHHVTSMDSLNESLSGNQKWDLMIISAEEMPENLSIESTLDRMEQHGRDIPAVVLSDHPEEEALDLLKQDVRSVIARDNDELLLLVSDREISDLNTRRNYRRMSVALNESEKQRRNLLDDQVDAILYVSEGIIRYSNPAFNELLGEEETTNLAGKSLKELVAPQDQKDVVEFLESIEDSGQALAAIQCPLINGEGQQLPVRAMVSPTSFDGRYTLSLLVRPQEGVEPSLMEREEAEAARPDSETRLFNKNQFKEHLDVAAQRVISGKDKFALLCVTLDTLRAVHAKGGKKASQPMLREVSKRMGISLIEHKAASWGGDCFMALVKASDEKSVQTVAEQLLEEVAGEEVEIGNSKIPVKLSLGAVMLTDSSSDVKTLLVRARHAASQSLKQGGGKLCFYQKRKISTVSSVEKHLAGMVSQALQSDGMKLMYQPIVSLKGSVQEHYDVQLQMTDVRGRQHDATSFRSKLDKNALWGKVDRWQVIQAGKDLLERSKKTENVKLFMHLGGSAMMDKEFLPWMGVAMKAAGIPMSNVVIEMSEQNIVRFNKQAPSFFKSVKDLGCSTGVSEFGCSLNPLGTIQPLNLDFVKVDPSFTKDLASDSKGEELKEMIQALSESGQQIIVPQVENATELTPLWHTGVDFVQGHFLQGPAESMDYDFGGDI